MGLLKILDGMSKEEGFQGAEISIDSNPLSRSYMGTNGRKILLNENLKNIEKIILENPELFEGFLYAILHEKHHKIRAKNYFCFSHYCLAVEGKMEKEDEIIDEKAIEDLKKRGKDPVKAFAWDLVIYSLIFDPTLDTLNYRLRTLGPLYRKKAMKLYREKMKDLASRYSNVVYIFLVPEVLEKKV